MCVSSKTLSTLELKMSVNKRALQQVLGLFTFRRKHVPDLSIIARPLYDLIWKRSVWDRTPMHEEALKLPI